MKMMSLGCNCANLSFLGEYRVPGPVDNWLANHGFQSVPHLFSDFKEQLISGYVKTRPHPIGFKGDSDTEYFYESYNCTHINMRDSKVLEKVLLRLNSMHEFLKQVKEKRDCFFVYTISVDDRINRNGKWYLKDEFMDALNEFQKIVSLKKVIFIGTKRVKDLSNNTYFMDRCVDVRPSYLNYLEIEDVSYLPSKPTQKKNHAVLKEYMERLLEGKKEPTQKFFDEDDA